MKTTILIIGLGVVLARAGAAQTNHTAPASTHISTRAQNRKGYPGVKAVAQTNQMVAPIDSNAPIKAMPTATKPKPLVMPKEITNSAGIVYKNIKVEKVDPGGLTIRYSITNGGLGITKIPYAQLPRDLQMEFGYDQQAAAEFQTGEKWAAARWAAKMAATEEAGRLIKVEKEKQAELAAQAARMAATNPPPPPPVIYQQQQPPGWY
jgi:hypothetical protein